MQTVDNNMMTDSCGARWRTAGVALLSGFLILVMLASQANAAERMLNAVHVSPSSGGGVQLQLEFSGPAPDTRTFTIDNPPRLAVDLSNSRVGKAKKSQALDTGVARDLRLVEAGNRTRVLIGLTRMVPYDIRAQDNFIYINLKGGAAAMETAAPSRVNIPSGKAGNQISNIDFRRGEKGQGRIIVKLSDPSVVVDSRTSGGKILVDFLNTSLPKQLQRRLDVTDFATPVMTIDAFERDSGTRLSITPTGEYDQMAYQVGDTYTIEVTPLTKAEKQAAAKKKEGQYTGERLSLNFQNIEVRAVLQLLADFTGLNIVASDTVRGNITLRLKNVPWDQALDIVLKSKGLGMRKNGNVVMIAPADEIAAREKLELEANKQIEELAPLHTQFFTINYAKAADIAALLKADKNSLLSKRGNVTVDERTNTLMVLDTREKLAELASVIEKLDIPVRQVLIESRIVIANDDFSRNLGVRWGTTAYKQVGNSTAYTSGSVEATDTMVGGSIASGVPTLPTGPGGINDRLNVNLPVPGAAGRLALAILGSDYLVDLELSALQNEGKGEVVSNPRVITSNQKEAVIEQGVEIPYQEATSSGATSTSFKKAVLSLSVTPQITPDDRVIMDLNVSKDSVGQVVSGVPTINTRAVQTQVLVNNGDTVVLGGIYEQEKRRNVEKVPLLGDLPLLGFLFRNTQSVDNKTELLIFVTPKILKEGLKAQLD